MKDPWSVKQLVTASQKLHALRLYERFSDSDFFLIRTPMLDDPALAVLMGNGGQTHGLNVFLGPSAPASYNALFTAGGEVQARRSMLQSHMLGYQMSDPMDLCHDTRKWLKKAKIRLTGERLYPDPISIEPGKVPSSTLKDRETRLLLQLARGILAAAEDKSFKPCGLDKRGQVLTIQLDQDTENPKAALSWKTCDLFAAEITGATTGPASVEGPEVHARFDLAALASSGDTWLVSLLPVPGSIEGDDRQPYMLMVCSERTQGMWPSVLMEGDPAAVVDALANLMRGEYEVAEGQPDGLTPPLVGLPTLMILDSSALCNALSATFESLGIECIDGEDDPLIQSLFQDLHATFDVDMRDDFDDGLWDGQIPASDDLAAWKHVDGLLKDTIHADFNSDRRFHGSRALKRYFGSDSDYDKILVEYRRLMVVDSYAHWFVTSYRSTRKQPTLSEQWLTSPEVPDAVKVLLKSTTETGPSIYRIGDVDEYTGKIEFVDLFTADITIVTDFALSTCLDPGLITPAKLVPTGDFHFFFPAGPVMNSLQFDAALDFFDFQDISPSPDVFREHPYMLGWLWDVVDQQKHQGLDLRNTDGDVLIHHTAIFVCPDRPAFERYLADRPDCDPEDDDTWVWFRDGAPGTPGHAADRVDSRDADGQFTVLGRLKLEDDQMTLTLNSRERFDTARTMLEQVDGIILQSLETQDLSDVAGADSALESKNLSLEEFTSPAPIAMGEEEADVARAYISNHYQQWLDHPLPAFQGKTPRQAAKDPKLRDQLAAIVRSIPDPMNLGNGSTQISAPREQLLAQLGFE